MQRMHLREREAANQRTALLFLAKDAGLTNSGEGGRSVSRPNEMQRIQLS